MNALATFFRVVADDLVALANFFFATKEAAPVVEAKKTNSQYRPAGVSRALFMKQCGGASHFGHGQFRQFGR
ncbi:hypothetical protein DBR42_22925 [Pelomonas sp. HMWF004]|nr:hypothetical protein DBR42_22925 [Pelomonas sp. HMWF004]